MKDLMVFFYNFRHQGGISIYVQAQICARFEVGIGVWSCFITKLANVGHLTGHNSFRDFPIQFVNTICSIRPYERLKFRAII